jgi:hypothetical protein
LWRELRALGYKGSASSVKPSVALLRQVPEDLLPPRLTRLEKAKEEEVLSVRRIIWLALMRPEKRTAEQAQELARVSVLSPQVSAALTLAHTCAALLREKHVEALPAWLESAHISPVKEVRQFAKSASSGTVMPLVRVSLILRAMGQPKDW